MLGLRSGDYAPFAKLLHIACNRAGVDVYIIDSGVYEQHKDFEGRAFNLASFVPGEEGTDTCGHGMCFYQV